MAAIAAVTQRGSAIGGYTRGGDAEPGSRCTSGTVLATVTWELVPRRHWAHRPDFTTEERHDRVDP